MFEKLVIAFLGILILREIIAVMNIFHTIKFYQSNQDSLLDENIMPIVVIIPVLNEFDIAETVRYFTEIDYPHLYLLVVTTQKERIDEKTLSTIKIVETIKNQYHFQSLHYPDEIGCKSDQLNYAISKIPEIYPTLDISNSFIAIYDADSRPNRYTFRYFSHFVKKYPHRNVFQQSSVFYSNLDVIKKHDNSLFLMGQTVRQTRFTLAYEVPRLINQISFYNGKPIWRYILGICTYAHCIGHGLFIRISFAQQIKFPYNDPLEDMFYGFVLNCLKEPIIPIPILTNSDMPINITDWFYQKSRWFLGPSRPFLYMKYVKSIYQKHTSKIRPWLLVGFALYDTFNWMLTSPVFAAILILWFYFTYKYVMLTSNFVSNVDFVLTIESSTFIGFYMYSVVVILLNHSCLQSMSGASLSENQLTRNDIVKIILTYPLILLSHSLPAFHSLWSRITKLFAPTEPLINK